MNVILETKHLRLREFTGADLDVLAPMVADEDQMRFYPNPRTRAEASDWIARNHTFYERHGFGMWFVESASGDFVGYCGIRPHEELPEVEIGWHTHKNYWNRGLTTEAAVACRDLAFDRFRLPRLIAAIDPGNAASIRVAEKIGMDPEGTIVLEGQLHRVYTMESPLAL